jgi:hypothetical protein
MWTMGSPGLSSNGARAICGGGPLKVQSRSHGKVRRHFYGCAWYHERGAAVCGNRAIVPIEDAVDGALGLLRTDDTARRCEGLDAEIRKADE